MNNSEKKVGKSWRKEREEREKKKFGKTNKGKILLWLLV